MKDSSRRRVLARRLSWLVVAALTTAALIPVPTLAVMGSNPAPAAESAQVVLWDGNPPACAEGTFHAVAVDPAANGPVPPTGDAIVNVSNLTDTSFDWALTVPHGVGNYDIAAVIVTGVPVVNQPTLNEAPELEALAVSGVSVVYMYADQSDDSDTNLETYSNPATESLDRLTRIEFCFNKKDHPTPPPSSAPPSSAPPSSAPPSTNPPTDPPTDPPTNPPTTAPPTTAPPTTAPPTTAPPTTAPPTTAPPSGGVGGQTGTPRITTPPTDTLPGPTPTPSSDSWRLILLAMAGVLAATLLLTPTGSTTRRKDR